MPCVLHTLFRQACKENIFMAQFQFCAMKRGRRVWYPEQRWPYISRMVRYEENKLSKEHMQVGIFFLDSIASTWISRYTVTATINGIKQQWHALWFQCNMFQFLYNPCVLSKQAHKQDNHRNNIMFSARLCAFFSSLRYARTVVLDQLIITRTNYNT